MDRPSVALKLSVHFLWNIGRLSVIVILHVFMQMEIKFYYKIHINENMDIMDEIMWIQKRQRASGRQKNKKKTEIHNVPLQILAQLKHFVA